MKRRSYVGRRTLRTLVSVAFLLISLTTVVLALPPVNDDILAAVVISPFALPFDDGPYSTLEATTALDDPDCAGNGPTVWYQFTPAEEMRVEFNTFGSNYDTTLSVYTGSPGALEQIFCNDDAAGSLQSRLRFNVVADETYFVMVGAFFSGPGGDLVFHAGVAPPPTEFQITVDPRGTFRPSTGEVTIGGTVHCTEPGVVSGNGELTQRAGRVTILGFPFFFVDCDGQTPWSATFQGQNGRYAGGNTKVRIFAFGQDFDDPFRFVEAEIRLSGRRR